MDILKIENAVNTVSGVVSRIGNEESAAAMQEATFILAEVRHFVLSCASLGAGERERAEQRLVQTLSHRYCQRPKKG